MHNAERTEARLNYSTVSGLPPSWTLHSTCKFQTAPSFYLSYISVFLIRHRFGAQRLVIFANWWLRLPFSGIVVINATVDMNRLTR